MPFSSLLRRLLPQLNTTHPQPQKPGSDIPAQSCVYDTPYQAHLFTKYKESFFRAHARNWDVQFLLVLTIHSFDDIAFCRTMNALTQQSFPHWKCLLFLKIPHYEEEHVKHLIATYNRAFPEKFSVSTKPLMEALANCSLTYQDQQRVFVSFLAPGDILDLTALERIASFQENRSADIIYTDHDTVDNFLKHEHPQCKPDWNPEFLNATYTIGPATFFRASLLQTIGVIKSQHSEEGILDLIRRACEHTEAICHLPETLFSASFLRTQRHRCSSVQLDKNNTFTR
ncbi:hypothetical protein KKC44_01845 [Patescibacteria group bacterium]|nr:hypothetical protein [Patescibacteria group bacterium]